MLYRADSHSYGSKLVLRLAEMAVADEGMGPAHARSRLATAIGGAGITWHGKRVRCYLKLDLVNALEQDKPQGRAQAPRACYAYPLAISRLVRQCDPTLWVCPKPVPQWGDFFRDWMA